jgi:dTDP-4-dehydrorhamnose 3,5-epimerase
MRFEALDIPGAMLVTIERKADPRGFFARSFCAEEFRRQGLPEQFVQCSISYNERRGTLRGMHFQWPPSREGKLVRCVRGRLFDVLIDLRPGSPAYLEHRAVVLDEDERNAVFIPHGIAHGFQTLVDRTEVFYQMTDFFAPHLNAGMRWDDPAFSISWPLSDPTLSERDAACARFDRGSFEAELAGRERGTTGSGGTRSST